MDKTITANFDSIDRATFAAKSVTDHFNTVKKVKVTYEKHSKGGDRGELGFSDYLLPYGTNNASGMPGTMGVDSMVGGMLPYAAAIALQQHRDHNDSIDLRKAKVAITAPEDIVRQIESALYTGGGLEVQVS